MAAIIIGTPSIPTCAIKKEALCLGVAWLQILAFVLNRLLVASEDTGNFEHHRQAKDYSQKRINLMGIIFRSKDLNF